METNSQLADLLRKKTDIEMGRLREECDVDIAYDKIMNLMAKRISENKEASIKGIQIKFFFNIKPGNVYYNQINKEVLTKVKVKLKANGFKVKIGTYAIYNETYLDVYVKNPNLLTNFIQKFK